MFLRFLHLVVSLGSLALLAFDAPKGSFLVPDPERGKVQAKSPTQRTTARGRGPTFLWLGGGYHGGK